VAPPPVSTDLPVERSSPLLLLRDSSCRPPGAARVGAEPRLRSVVCCRFRACRSAAAATGGALPSSSGPCGILSSRLEDETHLSSFARLAQLHFTGKKFSFLRRYA